MREAEWIFAAAGAAALSLMLGACSPSAAAADPASPGPAPLAEPAPEPAPEPVVPLPTVTSGNRPGPAFILHLSKGFDERNQYLSDYVIEDAWNGAGFDPNNVHYGKDGATLVIQKRKMKSVNYAGAELQAKGFYGYGRYEAIVKAEAGSGLVSSFFTHTFEQFGDPHDEIDIEFMGRNNRELHLNYFKDGKPIQDHYSSLDFDNSADFHLYAFEWAPDSIKWFVDGKQIFEVHGSKAHIPRASGRVMMNLWTAGDAGLGWTGPREFKDNTSASYKCVSHVPLGKTGRQCSDDFAPPKS